MPASYHPSDHQLVVIVHGQVMLGKQRRGISERLSQARQSKRRRLAAAARRLL